MSMRSASDRSFCNPSNIQISSGGATLSLEPKLVIRLEGVPFQREKEVLYGDNAFEFTLPLPSYVFDDATSLPAFSRDYQFTTTPLPLDFRAPVPETKAGWKVRATSIYKWLVENAHERSRDEWLWSLNLFWISYSSANPSFPIGPLDRSIPWNPDVVPTMCEHIVQRAQGLDLRSPSKNQPWLIWTEWVILRDIWCTKGVTLDVFEARIGKYL